MEIALAGASAMQQRSAGKIAEMEAKTEAKQIETAAAAREADRKEDLARALASQAAGAGASGIVFEGSPLSVLEEDIRREKVAGEREGLTAGLGAMAARTRGKVASRQATAGAGVSLLRQMTESAKSAGKAAAGGGG